MITEMISIMVGGMTDIMDGIASQPLLLAGIAIFLMVNGINMVRTIIYDGYSPEEYAQHQEEYEEEPIPPTLPKDFKTQLKTGAEAKEFLRKLNYSVCPVCNAPVDNSRDTCKYCGSPYI